MHKKALCDGSQRAWVFQNGADGDRTHDLVTASHALSQLSYGPEWEVDVAVEGRDLCPVIGGLSTENL